MKTLKTFWLILLLSFFFSPGLYAQNEANIWKIPVLCGLDFNTGDPVVNDGFNHGGFGNATISDSLGNFLFAAYSFEAYSKNGPLPNSEGLAYGGRSGTVIVKWPGKDRIYYIFCAGEPEYFPGFYYSLVDMKLLDGQGYVTEKNIGIESGYDVGSKIGIVKREGNESVWVITRKLTEDAIASYLVDENGLNPNPVLSAMPDREALSDYDEGNLKISPDKKFLIVSYRWRPGYGGELEVCRFNSEAGTSEYVLTHKNLLNQNNGIRGFEYSPDSKLIYISFQIPNSDSTLLYQFETQYITDSALFKNSGQLIGTGDILDLQLARDGKIYCGQDGDSQGHLRYYLDVIHKPWIKGVGCMYENDAVNQSPHFLHGNLPNILVDYLLRFEWSGEQCQGYPIQFKPNFIPTPDSITWYFDEFAPGSLTHELNPVYAFQNAGIHEIVVDVWYPNGRYEHTSREIEIFPTPMPDLGPDILICEGTTDTLNANCEADFYSWNGLPGGPQYIVSDSGTYRVMATIVGTNCHGTDTIHVGFYPPTTIDETNIAITPTTCNGSSGSITGLTALGPTPFVFHWLDLSGNDYGTNIDATGLPAGQYQLTITDGNGCTTVSDVYTIEDAGNLQVLDVELTQPHCGRPDGQIVIHAFSPSASVLQYSIDDGVTYQADSIFSGLVGASYLVRVTDGAGCFGFYVNNPVILANIPGPQVTQVNVTNETDGLGNGAIKIVASGSTPVIYYSIDGGNTWQLNDGIFGNLVSGMWYVVIKDENGCDTTFTVEIQNVILTYLHAVTGEGGHCLGNTALVPVNVDNFNSVATFHLKLSYNADNLQCEGFANVHSQLVDSLTGWVDQGAGEINLAWKSASPVTFNQPEKVADLVFTTKNPGQGQLSWYTGTTESYFTNATGNPIPAQFQTGEVKIYEPPEIILDQSKTFCTGQFVSIMSIAIGNQPPLTYRWIYPAGDTTNNDPFFFAITQANAGLYTLLATDRVGCSDQKSIDLIVSENPVAVFHGIDTLEMHAGDMLDAGSGMASYKWNTGDTTESIIIPSLGKYSVEMESLFGCTGRDSIYIKLTSDEIPSNNIFIPNAFSPDGDGLNDIFMATATSDYIQKFYMLIFDRWGGEIFESNDIMLGWDGTMHGTLLPGGIYTYKITYSIYPSFGDYSEQVRLGTVMMVR